MTKDTQLTTLQAADILAVSPAFVTKLLEDGVIPHRIDGNHRLIHIDDLLTYKTKIDQQRDTALDELAAQAQQLGMGYLSLECDMGEDINN